ncbi:MAG: metal ABC transporter solute-binding protein, Zn/Mn family [Thermoleophilaceae bacterium]
MAKLLIALLLTLAVAGCTSAVGADPHKLQVVAAENFWGSLAAQLGGDRVQVTSIVHEPATDPHDYEPTAADARRMAIAKLAIVNGVGYDPWAPKLLDANPVGGRVVLDVGKLVGVRSGGNPHRWYSPADVQRVIDRLEADYERLDSRHAAYYRAQRTKLETQGLARYRVLIAGIRARFAGTPGGASESIFEPLAQSLGLRLITPSGLLNAVSEGTEPTAADKTTADRQISGGQIRLWVYNSQNSTPDVQRLTSEARSAGIPVATVTETLTPASASFQQWQARQLLEIEQALGP